ncbi:radical SAM protein, partial [Candidatus Woesearchaeota archaeon]|nr:radical SAM protein [Candidatus Woesearchaeota archaeon]
MAKVVYIKTFGCSQNVSDSERMAGVLESEGYEIVSNGDEADVVVINSCTVKNEAETKLYREIIKHKDKKIVVAGCVAQADTELKDFNLKDYSIVGTSQTSKIAMVVNETLKGNRVVLLDKDQKNIDIPRIRRNEVVEIIPINEGCLGNCTYCKVKAARGDLSSYKKEDIVKLAIKAVNSGAKQLWITSQDTGAYGIDINETLPKLLNEIVKINGDFKVRLGMCNPNFALKYIDDLIEILNNEKMFRFIHIPLQSG